MAEIEKEEFKFPDEVEINNSAETEDAGFEIEIEDDTPSEDRNREPMPKEIVEKLEQDELDKYSDEAKEKLKQLRKVWHDERREKEQATREREEALDAAGKLLSENKKMREMLNSGQQDYVAVHKQSADLQLEMAKKAYKEAYDSGDTDKIIEAQQAITNATLQVDKVKNYRPAPLQEESFVVQREEQRAQPPRFDEKLNSWQERNGWFGQDEEMTASALGLHEKLKKQGVVVGSDEYYAILDKTIRKRFPENFGDQEVVEAKPREDAPKAKPSTVVAPATRSTSSKQVKLKTSQVNIAKKLGLTNEQYVRELLKIEGA
jgi:hypothetical protein